MGEFIWTARHLPTRLRERRKELRMTLRALHEEAGISTGFLCDVENGKRSISADSLCRLCAALAISPDYLLSD